MKIRLIIALISSIPGSFQQIKNCTEYYTQLNRGCKACNPGFYKSLNEFFICYKCSPNCLSCLDRSTCLHCNDTFFLQTLSNSKEDIKNYNLPLYNKTCSPCPENCAICSSSLKCNNCIKGYTTVQGECYQNNPILSIIFTISLCVYVFIICLKNSFQEIDKRIVEKRKMKVKEGEKRLIQQRNRMLSMMTIDSAMAVRNTIRKIKNDDDLRVSKFKENKKNSKSIFLKNKKMSRSITKKERDKGKNGEQNSKIKSGFMTKKKSWLN